MELIAPILPIVVVFILLVFRQHMLFAGLVGAALTVLFGRLSLETSNNVFLNALHQKIGVEVPLIYGALAVMLYNAGCFQALANLARHYGRGRHKIPVCLTLVLLHGVTTYLFGSASSMTAIFAPVLAHLVGTSPWVVAALSIVSAVGFSTSPASTETFITAQVAGRDIIEHSVAMFPYTIWFYVLALVLATWGLWKHKPSNAEVEPGIEPAGSLGGDWRRALPVFTLLLLEIACPFGFAFLTPLSILVIVFILTLFCMRIAPSEMCRLFLEGSMKVAERLFSIGLFLGFLTLMGEWGAGSSLLALTNHVPPSFLLPIVMLLAFVVAIPIGIHCSAILLMFLPTLAASHHLPSEALGLVTLATALGAHLSPVQVNIVSLGSKFDIPVSQVIRGNIPFIALSIAMLLFIAALI